MENRGRVALVLGAGSARGLAHIGILQVLLENKVPFDFIVGSSMGAMVGGIYACGTDLYMLGKMTEHLDYNIFFDVGLPRMGFIVGKKIEAMLQLLTKKMDLNDAIIPVYMVATDLLSAKTVVFNSGPVAQAIRASISIPGVFAPVKHEGMVLVDGAVIERLPVEVAREKGADLVIAVDVSLKAGEKMEIKNTIDVILTSLDIMQKQQMELIHDSADILIEPAVGNYSSWDFSKAREIIQAGRKAAEEKLDEIWEKIARSTRLGNH